MKNYSDIEFFDGRILTYGDVKVFIFKTDYIINIYIEGVSYGFMKHMIGVSPKDFDFNDCVEIINRNIKDWRELYFEDLEILETYREEV